VFGAGGGTSSYREIEETDFIVLWGSNARAAHPIFFHHLLKGVHAGAQLFVVDPRRSESAQWADMWLGLDVGADIALANTVAAEIIRADLTNKPFIERATTGFDEFAASVEPWTLQRGEDVTGVPAAAIRALAHGYATAPTAQLCWTLGITEHHNGTENVLSLINLSLLTGHIGRWGSGLVPIRGQNNVQGGGDMGALPNKLPGFKDVADDAHRTRFEDVYGTPIPSEPGRHISLMLEAMEQGDIRALYVMGENPVQSEADAAKTTRILGSLDHLVVQDLFLTATAELADVVLPAAGWGEVEGSYTSSERRVQWAQQVIEPPGQARTDGAILTDLARRLGQEWPTQTVTEVWDELRSLSAMHAGMSYERLTALGGLQWPCPDEQHPGSPFLHGRLWSDDVGMPAPFTPVDWVPPLDELSDDYPMRLTTGRRMDSYNTGVQSGRFSSPRRIRGGVDLAPEDAERLAVDDGDTVEVRSRRGAVTAPVRVDRGLRPGLAFMSIHFPDDVDVNQLTDDAWDPRSGTAEFKATAVRIEKAL
jgi:predicted molibdopterin-dependent oxidoreductase YjgC